MIGYQYVDAGRVRRVDRLERGNAVVRRHDQARARFDRPLNAGRFHPVSVPVAVRQDRRDIGAHPVQEIHKHGRACHAVYVVVAVYDDPLARANRLYNAVRQPVHVFHGKRVLKHSGVSRRYRPPSVRGWTAPRPRAARPDPPLRCRSPFCASASRSDISASIPQG